MSKKPIRQQRASRALRFHPRQSTEQLPKKLKSLTLGHSENCSIKIRPVMMLLTTAFMALITCTSLVQSMETSLKTKEANKTLYNALQYPNPNVQDAKSALANDANPNDIGWLWHIKILPMPYRNCSWVKTSQPLLIAFVRQSREIFDLLLDNKANPDLSAESAFHSQNLGIIRPGSTPLLWSCLFVHCKILTDDKFDSITPAESLQAVNDTVYMAKQILSRGDPALHLNYSHPRFGSCLEMAKDSYLQKKNQKYPGRYANDNELIEVLKDATRKIPKKI